MNCPEAEQFFDAYLDGELSGSLRLEFDAHRLRCSACQQKLAMMEACEHILARDTRMPTLSEGFTDRVMTEIAQRRLVARRTRKRRITIAATVALQAAAVIVFAVVWSGFWKAKPVPETREEFIAKVGDAIEEKDAVRIKELMSGYADQLAVARSNLEKDVSGLPRYAGHLINDGVIDAFSSLSDATLWDAFNIFRPATPEPAEEIEPASPARGRIEL